MTLADGTTTRDRTLARLGDALQALLAAQRRVRGREAKSREGLSFAQWRLLHPLARDDRVSAVSLARSSELTPATVTGMLDQLVAAGLVERTRSEVDRRVVHSRLTPAGRAAYRAKEAELREKWEQAVTDLTDEELEAGILLLARLRGYFESL